MANVATLLPYLSPTTTFTWQQESCVVVTRPTQPAKLLLSGPPKLENFANPWLKKGKCGHPWSPLPPSVLPHEEVILILNVIPLPCFPIQLSGLHCLVCLVLTYRWKNSWCLFSVGCGFPFFFFFFHSTMCFRDASILTCVAATH